LAYVTNRIVALTIGIAAPFAVLLTSAAAAPQGTVAKKPTAAAIAAGKKVYQANKCANCHMINGVGGKGGPDLSSEGLNTKHTPAWLEAEVKAPTSHKPDSSMPPFGDKIKGADMSNLVAYLGSLKKK
jgi:mono/diheme cytochrome c family protein